MNNIERIIVFRNTCRLLVILDTATGCYHWRVSQYEGGAWWMLGASTVPVSLDEALAQGDMELQVWSEGVEA